MGVGEILLYALLFGAVAFVIAFAATALPSILQAKKKKRRYTIADTGHFDYKNAAAVKNLEQPYGSSVDQQKASDKFSS